PLRSIETNNSVEGHELQATNVEVTVNKRKKGPNRTNVKRRREYEEPDLINSDEPPLRSTETNNSVEDLELQAMNVEVTTNKEKRSSNRTNTKRRIGIEPSLIISDDEIIRSSSPSSLTRDNLPSKNSAQQREQASNASSSSSLIKNTSSYKQQSFVSKASPSFSVRSDSPESIYSERSPSPNIASPPLINNSFEDTNNQQRPSISNDTDISSTSLIGPFKNDLEICLYLVQHPNLIKLTLNMIEAGGQGSTGIQEKADKFNVLPERDLGTLQMHLKGLFFRTHTINKHIIDALIRSLFKNIQPNASERTTLQRWAFACFRDYNASLRKELRNLVPEFIRKYKLTKSKPPELKQLSEYITEKNWQAFLKRYIDILDLEKTFRKRPENVAKFTKFIRTAFNLFVQENLLDKDVINEVKDLNYMTVNMIIFTADGNDSSQQLDLGSLLKVD
ncbi:6582_t:CDS:2, partial [Gigaspora margarita]